MGGKYLRYFVLPLFICIIIGDVGCSVEGMLKSVSKEEQPDARTKPLTLKEREQLYDTFLNRVASGGIIRENFDRGPLALRHLPRDAGGNVNWTTAVVKGYIDPRASIDPDKKEEELLNLNIFIEAKVPLMANVVFPHSIHTYWLKCNNCHPKIFIPEAGANSISMNEIFEGKWCGRCHGKVAFDFWPELNCRRCHMVPKKMSAEKEIFK